MSFILHVNGPFDIRPAIGKRGINVKDVELHGIAALYSAQEAVKIPKGLVTGPLESDWLYNVGVHSSILYKVVCNEGSFLVAPRLSLLLLAAEQFKDMT